MAEPKRRPRRASAPDSLLKKADDRHPYGGVRSEPLKGVDIDVTDPRPKPALRRRRRPRARVEDPYPEPREKNRPPTRD